MYTNRNSHSDFALSAIERHGQRSSSVNIAVPFFTDASTIEWLVNKGCEVRLIVRLGFPTSADALRRFLRNPKVQMRYFTGPAFHSKLYIFGDHTALVGSANLTDRAMRTNQEILLTVSSDDHRFEELVVLFSEYWEHACVLTEEELKKYDYLCRQHDSATTDMYTLDKEIVDALGLVTSGNIKRNIAKQSEAVTYLNDYRKTYQETVAAFLEVKALYEATGTRKVPPELIPLRLEIDSFISFVRTRHATGELWNDTNLPTDIKERSERISPLIAEWHKTPWDWFENHIIHEAYPLLKSVFESPESLKSASNDMLLDALCVAHSFHDRLRFYDGGLPTLRATFLKANGREKINKTLTYLVFGHDETVRRMCNVIFGTGYKLEHFGRSNVQELVGWVNQEDLPVINGRTTKILCFFGFKVRQCQ